MSFVTSMYFYEHKFWTLNIFVMKVFSSITFFIFGSFLYKFSRVQKKILRIFSTIFMAINFVELESFDI